MFTIYKEKNMGCGFEITRGINKGKRCEEVNRCCKTPLHKRCRTYYSKFPEKIVLEYGNYKEVVRFIKKTLYRNY